MKRAKEILILFLVIFMTAGCSCNLSHTGVGNDSEEEIAHLIVTLFDVDAETRERNLERIRNTGETGQRVVQGIINTAVSHLSDQGEQKFAVDHERASEAYLNAIDGSSLKARMLLECSLFAMIEIGSNSEDCYTFMKELDEQHGGSRSYNREIQAKVGAFNERYWNPTGEARLGALDERIDRQLGATRLLEKEPPGLQLEVIRKALDSKSLRVRANSLRSLENLTRKHNGLSRALRGIAPKRDLSDLEIPTSDPQLVYHDTQNLREVYDRLVHCLEEDPEPSEIDGEIHELRLINLKRSYRRDAARSLAWAGSTRGMEVLEAGLWADETLLNARAMAWLGNNGSVDRLMDAFRPPANQRQRRDNRLFILEALEWLGPAARNAAPELRKFVAGESGHDFFYTQEEKEKALALAREILRQIEG